MTTQPAPAAECEHPEDRRRWLSGCCGTTFLVQLVELEGDVGGLCAGCRGWAPFELNCIECGATVEATGEAT